MPLATFSAATGNNSPTWVYGIQGVSSDCCSATVGREQHLQLCYRCGRVRAKPSETETEGVEVLKLLEAHFYH